MPIQSDAYHVKSCGRIQITKRSTCSPHFNSNQQGNLRGRTLLCFHLSSRTLAKMPYSQEDPDRGLNILKALYLMLQLKWRWQSGGSDRGLGHFGFRLMSSMLTLWVRSDQILIISDQVQFLG